jgi:hypothetical protein
MKKLAALGALGIIYSLWAYLRGRSAKPQKATGFDVYEDETAQEYDAPQIQQPIETPNIFEQTVTKVKAIFSANEIKAVISSGSGYLIVERPDGRKEKLTGARNWRNNNPGNLQDGPFARKHGAIGTDGRFAVFPTYEIGRKAKEKLIFEGMYAPMKLSEIFKQYAPEFENDTAWYSRTVVSAVGTDKVMKTYTPGERQTIMDAMERVEGYKVGTVTAWA